MAGVFEDGKLAEWRVKEVEVVSVWRAEKSMGDSRHVGILAFGWSLTPTERRLHLRTERSRWALSGPGALIEEPQGKGQRSHEEGHQVRVLSDTLCHPN
jgi:hypothetical protein